MAGQKKLATDNKKNIKKKLMIIPYDKLSTEALEALIEEFVTRDGTDTGYEKKSFENDVAMVKRQLKRGDAVIVYDQNTQTSNIVLKDHLEKSHSK